MSEFCPKFLSKLKDFSSGLGTWLWPPLGPILLSTLCFFTLTADCLDQVGELHSSRQHSSSPGVVICLRHHFAVCKLA